MRRLDCVLFFPPPGAQFQVPEIGLPQLTSFLRTQGAACEAVDLNRTFMEDYLFGRQDQVRERVARRLGRAKGRPLLKVLDAEDFLSLDFSKTANHSYSFIADDAAELWNELLAVNADRYDIADVVRSAKRGDALFDPFYREHVRPWARRTGLVGFSVETSHQLASALHFSKRIKADRPGTKVVLGGTWFICTRPFLKPFSAVFDFADFVVPVEGERPLLDLIRLLRKTPSPADAELRRVAGLVLRSGDRLVDTGDPKPVPMASLSAGDFAHFKPGRFIGSQYPVLSTKGCYWNRCRFCFHSYAGVETRSKTAGQVLREMKQVVSRYRPKEIELADSAVPLSLLKSLPAGMRRQGLKVPWTALVRADEGLTRQDLGRLKASGCLNLGIGLESADPAVLRRSDKGIRLEVLDRLLDEASQVGLRVSLFLIYFPFEDRRSYERSWRYVLDRRDKIADVSAQYLFLGRNSRLFAEPGRWGLRLAKGFEQDTRSFWLPYSCRGALSKAEFYALTSEKFRLFYERSERGLALSSAPAAACP